MIVWMSRQTILYVYQKQTDLANEFLKAYDYLYIYKLFH